MRPRIAQADEQVGFHWVTPRGVPISLPDLMVGDEEPDRLVATHLEALDDLFDSSGVNKDATLKEHREGIRAVLAAAALPEADPLAVACALDWLLYDWLMAHRDGPDSAAVEIPKGREEDAGLIVDATADSVRARAAFDPGLLAARPS